MSDTAALAETREAINQYARPEFRRFKIDHWATDLNLTELGILQHTQHQAASRQFTKDMEIIGQVVEDGDRTGLIAYREQLWENESETKRRLVIKLFTDNFNWRGTLDMMTGRSLQMSLSSGGTPVVSFSVNVARHDQLVQLERVVRKWPFEPESYTFFILGDAGPKFYKLRRKVFGIGADFVLLDQTGNKLGTLDARLLNLGGAWKVKLLDDHANPTLVTVLQLFGAYIKFNGQARRHMGRLAKLIRRGHALPEIDQHEEDLYMNPRRGQ